MSRFYTSSLPAGLRVRSFSGLTAADLALDVNNFFTNYTSSETPKLRSVAAAPYSSVTGSGRSLLSRLRASQRSLHTPLGFWEQAVSKLSSYSSPLWRMALTVVDDGTIAQAGDVVITIANPRVALREVAANSDLAIDNAYAACETELDGLFTQALIFETIFVAGLDKHLVGLLAQEE